VTQTIPVANRTVEGSLPYAWPFHGALVPEQTALVACLDPRWRTGAPEDEDSDRRLVQLNRVVRSAGGLVVAITTTASPRGPAWTTPEAFSPRKMPDGFDPHLLIDAVGTSAFVGSRLDQELRNRSCSDLLLAGWGLEGPVHSTLRAANDRGFECLLVADASTSLDPSLTFAADQMVCFSGGIFGAIATSSDVVAAYEALGGAQ
jgi:nicotinamidase-related amidase